MNWEHLTSLEQLDNIIANNETTVLFKHSTRCPVSSMAKRSLEFDADLVPDTTTFYYLDLIAYRPISNKIAEIWNVRHESPQILIVKGDQCIHHTSHDRIDMADIVSFLQ